MNKVELQAKLDSLADELNFLRNLYEAVSVEQNGMEPRGRCSSRAQDNAGGNCRS